MLYKGVCREAGKEVPTEYALGYALSRILSDPKEAEEFVEWYYSANWYEETEEGDEGYEG